MGKPFCAQRAWYTVACSPSRGSSDRRRGRRVAVDMAWAGGDARGGSRRATNQPFRGFPFDYFPSLILSRSDQAHCSVVTMAKNESNIGKVKGSKSEWFQSTPKPLRRAQTGLC